MIEHHDSISVGLGITRPTTTTTAEDDSGAESRKTNMYPDPNSNGGGRLQSHDMTARGEE